MSKKLMRKKLAMMLATLKKKRKFFCEVEYLESTGTQYIDTGIKYNINKTYQIKNKMVYTATQAQSQGNGWDAGGQNSILNNGGIIIGSTVVSENAVGKVIELTQTINSGSGTLSVYNYMVDSISLPEVSRTHPSLSQYAGDGGYGIFAMYSISTYNYFCKAKCYKYKILEDNVLVRDFIPVLDWNMTPCMYDRVTEQLFYNEGTGDFTAGREIHYVDYLENITSQASLNYIPTKYTPTTNTNLEAKVRYTGGASGATWAIGAATWWGIHYQGSGPKIGITNSSSDPYQVYAPYTAGNDITLKLDGSNVYADGTLIGSLTKQKASSTLTIFRYATSANLSWVGRIYYLDMWDNNGDVFKFRPAIDENGTAFLFDQVSHTCYLNAGTGNFAYPPVELEYLESTGTQWINADYIPKTNDVYVRYKAKVNTIGENITFGIYPSGNITLNMNLYQSNLAYFRILGSNTPEGISVPNGVTVPHEYELSVNAGKIDSRVVNTPSILGSFTNNTSKVVLFARGANAAGTTIDYPLRGRIYYFTIQEGATLIRDFIPVFQDGQAGMLDKANNVFYSNAGTGTFTAGKIVEPEYE